MITSLLVHPDEVSKTWIDRMADAGVTVLGIHPAGGKKAVDSLTDLLQRVNTPEFRELIDYAKDRGLEIEYEFHAAGYLLPRALFAAHPEYFRVDAEGNRTPDWNFCVSNKEALEQVTERAMEVIKSLYGSRPYYYLWLDDKRGSHCHCEKCSAYSCSDQQMLVINAIAEKLEKWNPAAKIAYLAYCDSVLPPAIKPHGNVFVEYAPFEKYVSRDKPERIRMEQEAFDQLLQVFGTKDLKILEYWYDNSMYSGWKKPPKEFFLDRVAMDRDIAGYKKNGAQQIASFACFLGPDYEELYTPVDITPFVAAIGK